MKKKLENIRERLISEEVRRQANNWVKQANNWVKQFYKLVLLQFIGQFIYKVHILAFFNLLRGKYDILPTFSELFPSNKGNKSKPPVFRISINSKFYGIIKCYFSEKAYNFVIHLNVTKENLSTRGLLFSLIALYIVIAYVKYVVFFAIWFNIIGLFVYSYLNLKLTMFLFWVSILNFLGLVFLGGLYLKWTMFLFWRSIVNFSLWCFYGIIYSIKPTITLILIVFFIYLNRLEDYIMRFSGPPSFFTNATVFLTICGLSWIFSIEFKSDLRKLLNVIQKTKKFLKSKISNGKKE